jgi:hypothetical protein
MHSRTIHARPHITRPAASQASVCLAVARDRICFKRRKVNLTHVFAGQTVGVTQVAERMWLVTFMHYDFGLLRR